MKNLRKIILMTILLSTFFKIFAEKEITCSIPPIAFLTENLLNGTKIKVSSMLSINDDPHSYESTAKQLQSVNNSTIYFHCAMAFQKIMAKKMQEKFPQLTIVDLSLEIPKATHKHTHNCKTCSDDEFDPHVWLSLVNLQKITSKISTELIKKFPQQKTNIKNNQQKISTSLIKNHQNLLKKLSQVKMRTFFIYHPAFGYFAQDYKLQQKALEVGGKEPSPKQLLKLIEDAKNAQAKIIFVQTQFSQKAAKLIAKRINGKVIEINPMAKDSQAEINKLANAILNEK